MFKKEFGISIYPEHSDIKTIKKYLNKAKACGFTKLFMSWFQIRNKEKNRKLDIETIKYAKDLGFYIVLDIHDDKFKFYEDLGVDCVRLDAPVLSGYVAKATYLTQLDIQLDISGNTSFINEVIDYEPVIENISGCHNFYPLVNSGLSWDYFKKSTKRFNDLGLHTSAFINSQVGEYGPQACRLEKGVVTIEDLRNKPLRNQVKYLLATKQIDAVYIGNQFASDAELESITTIDTKKIEFDLCLKKEINPLELKIINGVGTSHYYRGDTSENYIRSCMPRLDFKNEVLEPDNLTIKNNLSKGDVFIFNSNELNYQNELIIIKNDTEDLKRIDISKCNYIGRISKDDLDLLNIIKEHQAFKFKIVK